MPPNVRPKKRASAITSSRECEEFFHTVPEFERMLVRSGIILIKYWFSITDQEQNLQVPCQEVHHDPITLPDREHKPDYARHPVPKELYVPTWY